MPSPVLVAGPPRSGTTWVAETLAAHPETRLVHEPDNHRLWPAAVIAKAGLGRHPVLSAEPDQSYSQARETAAFEALWRDAAAGVDNQALGADGKGHGLRIGWRLRRGALSTMRSAWVDSLLAGSTSFGGGIVTAIAHIAPKPPLHPAPHLVIKSVQATFALEYVSRLIESPVVIVRRDPRNAVASWLDLGWTIPRYEDDPGIRSAILDPAGIVPPPQGSPATELAWAYSLLDFGMATAAARNPGWVTANHEDLCDDPVDGFRSICEATGLPWSNDIEASLSDSDAQGDGYATTRIRSEQRNRWQSRLDDSQLADIAAVQALFPNL